MKPISAVAAALREAWIAWRVRQQAWRHSCVGRNHGTAPALTAFNSGDTSVPNSLQKQHHRHQPVIAHLHMRPDTEEALLATPAALGELLRQTWDDRACQPEHTPTIAVPHSRVNNCVCCPPNSRVLPLLPPGSAELTASHPVGMIVRTPSGRSSPGNRGPPIGQHRAELTSVGKARAPLTATGYARSRPAPDKAARD